MFRKKTIKITNTNNNNTESKTTTVKTTTSLRPQTSSRPQTELRSQASIMVSLQEKKPDVPNISNDISDANNILKSLINLKLTNIKNSSQAHIMRQNIDAHLAIQEIYSELADYNLAYLNQRKNELEEKKEKVTKELNSILLDTDLKIYTSKTPQQPSSNNSNSISATVEKEQIVTFNNIESKVIELCQKIKLCADQENKSDPFVASIQKFADTLISTIKGNMGEITLIADIYPVYAEILTTSEAVEKSRLELDEFMKDKAPKDLGTTSFSEFSNQLNIINSFLDKLKESKTRITDKWNHVLEGLFPGITDLKNQMQSIQGELDNLQSIAIKQTHKEVFKLMKSLHLILSALIGTAEIMYSDIVKHPRFDLATDIKNLDAKLDIPNQKLAAIKSVHARQAQRLHATASVSANASTELSTQKQNDSHPTLKL